MSELGRELMRGVVVGTGKRLEQVGQRLATLLTSLLRSRDLQESKARLEEAQRVAHVGYWVWNLDTNQVTWSDETYRIYGLRPQEGPIDLATVRELIHPEDRESVFRTAEEAVLGGVLPDSEHRVLRPDGDVRIVDRDTPLAKERAIAQSQLDNDIQASRAARAAVKAAEAQVEQAHLNAEFTNVRSLVDGIAGIAQVQIGNLVRFPAVRSRISAARGEHCASLLPRPAIFQTVRDGECCGDWEKNRRPEYCLWLYPLGDSSADQCLCADRSIRRPESNRTEVRLKAFLFASAH